MQRLGQALAILGALLGLWHAVVAAPATIDLTSSAAGALARGAPPLASPSPDVADLRRFLDWVTATAPGDGALILVTPGRSRGRETLRYYRASIALAPRPVWWTAPLHPEDLDWHEPWPSDTTAWRERLDRHHAVALVLDGVDSALLVGGDDPAPSRGAPTDAARVASALGPVRWFDESRHLGLVERPR